MSIRFPEKKKLRICYFIPYSSPHSKRFLNYFGEKGHELFVFDEKDQSFFRWGQKTCKESTQETQHFRDSNDNKLTLKERIGVSAPRLFLLLKTVHIFSMSFMKIIKNMLRLVFPFTQNKRYIVDYIRRARRIRNEVSHFRPHIVHGHYVAQNAIDVLLSGFRPNILTVWGSDIRDEDPLTRIQYIFRQMALKNAEAITAPSKDLISICIRKGISKNKCHLIGMPGIDVSKYENPSPIVIDALMPIPRDRDIILSPRSITDWYRIENIVHAFAKVKEKYPKAFLLLLDYNSDKKYLKQIEELIKLSHVESDVFIYKDMPYPFESMENIYAKSKVVVSIPKSDGMPQSIFESFAAGCPVVSSSHKTYDEVIEHNVSGLRVSGDDTKELANAVLRLLLDKVLRQKIVKNAREIVYARGNVFTELKKMQDLYYSLAFSS